MEEQRAYHWGSIAIEIHRDTRKYQLLVPLGGSWDEAEQTIDLFKTSLQEMKKMAIAQAEAAASLGVPQSNAATDIAIEPEIVS